MKTENEIKAMIETIATAAYGRAFEDWEITKYCTRKATYNEAKKGYWNVTFPLIYALPTMSSLANIDKIIRKAGGEHTYLYSNDNRDLFINFIIR